MGFEFAAGLCCQFQTHSAINATSSLCMAKHAMIYVLTFSIAVASGLQSVELAASFASAATDDYQQLAEYIFHHIVHQPQQALPVYACMQAGIRYGSAIVNAC